jgi:hypothetical protein
MVQLWTLSNKQEENLFGQEFHDKRKSKEKALVIALQKLLGTKGYVRSKRT